MDLKGFVDRAKGAAASAADRAKEVAAVAAEQAKLTLGAAPLEPPTSLPDELASAPGAEEPSDVAPEPRARAPFAAAKISELTTLGAEKIRELVSSFQAALPAIKSAGYELTEFEIELGVTPKLIPHFLYNPRSADDVAAARESLRDNRLGTLVLGALLKAGEVHKQIHVAGFAFSHVEIELGFIPSVRMQYKKG